MGNLPMKNTSFNFPKTAKFIAIEGGEGSGKTTQIEKIKKEVKDLHQDDHYIFLKEPGGTEEAQIIRKILLHGYNWTGLEELLLFNTARVNNIKNNILPALHSGKTVIIDRFILSTLSIQTQRNVPESLILDLHKTLCYNLFPDKTLYLDIDPKIAVARSLERQKNGIREDRFEKFPMKFHENVRKYSLETAKSYNTTVINANRSIEDIFKDIKKEIGLTLN